MNTPISQFLEELSISEILEELSMVAVKSDADGRKYEYSEQDLMNATHIFMHILGTKAYDLGKKEDIPFEVMEKQATAMGNELYEFIKKFTDIDTKKFYS
jgi:hypothetical protein